MMIASIFFKFMSALKNSRSFFLESATTPGLDVPKSQGFCLQNERGLSDDIERELLFLFVYFLFFDKENNDGF